VILLTGASGFFGKVAYRILSSREPTVGLCHRNTCGGRFTPVDLTQPHTLDDILAEVCPDVVVHSAALRDPDACEREPVRAEALHVRCTMQLAAWCARHGALLVYISTDYVFDGLTPPYREDSPVCPLSMYGRTKATGEQAARAAPEHIVIRMPLQYGYSQAHDDSFVLKVLEAIRSGERRETDNVQLRYPTLSDDVALSLCTLRARSFTGTIHMRGPTRATRLEMWQAIALAFDLPHKQIVAAPRPVRVAAARPPDSRLDTALYDSLGLPALHTFADGLRIVKSSMEADGYDWRAK
jgi:S-adenosylmethionine synthetase